MSKPDWLEPGKVNFLVQMAQKRTDYLPDVPAIAEFADSEQTREAIGVIFASFEAGRVFGAPPGVPADRIEILRRAFDATMKDPAFLAYSRQINLDVNPITGEQLEQHIKDVYSSSPAVIDATRKLIE